MNAFITNDKIIGIDQTTYDDICCTRGSQIDTCHVTKHGYGND